MSGKLQFYNVHGFVYTKDGTTLQPPHQHRSALPVAMWMVQRKVQYVMWFAKFESMIKV